MGAELDARRRRLLNLAGGELTASAVFIVAVVIGVQPRTGAAAVVPLWVALAPLVLILVQAAFFWLLRAGWMHTRPPHWFGAVYGALRVMDPVLIVGCAVASVLLWDVAGPGVRVLCVAALLFGVIEYLNYFVVRLSYPIATWASRVGARRTPRLVIDLRRARGQ